MKEKKGKTLRKKIEKELEKTDKVFNKLKEEDCFYEKDALKDSHYRNKFYKIHLPENH